MAVYTTIDDPSAHFQIALYTGDAVSGKAVTNAGNSDLQPDIIWIKNRSNTHDWVYQDSTMGLGNRLTLNTQDDLESSVNYVKTFTSDGFTVGTEGAVNASSNGTYAAFQWKVQGGTRTTFTESGDNPGGGRQVNADAGVALIDYTGTGATGTLTHGLGAIPQMILLHDRGGNHHAVYHAHMSDGPGAVPGTASCTDFQHLNENSAAADSAGYWNDTIPTSTVFTVQSNNKTNGNDRIYQAMVFTPIQGYSKFGRYTGNGNANGAFIYTGFKPNFIIIKGSSIGEHWRLFDGTREPYNPADKSYFTSTNLAEADEGDSSSYLQDILCNGFKHRSGDDQSNLLDNQYIYAAFAENPFVTSKGIPTTAR